MGPVVIGVDVGQQIDPTAIAVIEEVQRPVGGVPVSFFLARHLERLPLRTSYPDVGKRIATLVELVRARNPGGTTPRIYVDATGVGRPVCDSLQSQGIRVRACFFNHGDKRERKPDGSVSIGKGWLVSKMQVLLQERRLKLPRTPEAAALADELLVYEIRVSEDGSDKYGSFSVGKHDDLVTALGLAVQDRLGQPGVIKVNPPTEAMEAPWSINDYPPAHESRGQHFEHPDTRRPLLHNEPDTGDWLDDLRAMDASRLVRFDLEEPLDFSAATLP